MSFKEGGDWTCNAPECRDKNGNDYHTGSVDEWNKHNMRIDKKTGTTHRTESGANVCGQCGSPVVYENIPYVPYREVFDDKGKSMGRTKDFSFLVCDECQKKMKDTFVKVKRGVI